MSFACFILVLSSAARLWAGELVFYRDADLLLYRSHFFRAGSGQGNMTTR